MPIFRDDIRRSVIVSMCGLCLILTQIMKADEPLSDAVRQAFQKADRDRDGKLTVDEFLVGRGAAEVAGRDFKLYDFDENEKLDANEFACMRTAPTFDQEGVIPDYISNVVTSAVAALDKAFRDWDQNPDVEVELGQFLNAMLPELGNTLTRTTQREADPNGDRRVSRKEARRFVEIQLGVRRFDGQLLRLPNGNIVHYAVFMHADANKDDVLSRAEYMERTYGDPKSLADEFVQFNTNGDEVLSFEEYCRVPSKGFHDPVLEFRHLDANLDARIDPHELLAGVADWQKRLAQHLFPGFDFNQDGVLSLTEFCMTPIANKVHHWANGLQDSNNDEVISLEEFRFEPAAFPLLRMLYFQRFDTNGDKKLSESEYYFRLRIHPEFYVLNEDGTGWAPFFKLEKRDVGSPSVSPDGNWVAFDSYVGTVEGDISFVMNMVDHKPRELGLGLMPTWSPDSKRLALTRSTPQRGAWTINPDQSDAQFHGAGGGAQWSPDGKRVSYHAGLEIKAYNFETKETETLLPANENPYQQIFWNMSWSPDSSRICLKGLKPDATQEMAILDLSKNPQRKLRTRVTNKKALEADAAWHPSGHRVVIGMFCEERNRNQLYEFNPDTDHAPTLVKGQDPERHNSGSCWTPDGKRMIVVSWAD